MQTLFRAFVALPDDLCPHDRSLQERTVFFEAPYDYVRHSNADATKVIEQLLALAWGVDTTDWCEQGYIYNIRRERELLDEALGEGDARLLEIGWGGPERITYAAAADTDLFVTPRNRARLEAALRESRRLRLRAPQKALQAPA